MSGGDASPAKLRCLKDSPHPAVNKHLCSSSRTPVCHRAPRSVIARNEAIQLLPYRRHGRPRPAKAKVRSRLKAAPGDDRVLQSILGLISVPWPGVSMRLISFRHDGAPIAGVLGLKDAPYACWVHALLRGKNHGVEQNQGGYCPNESRADAAGSLLAGNRPRFAKILHCAADIACALRPE